MSKLKLSEIWRVLTQGRFPVRGVQRQRMTVWQRWRRRMLLRVGLTLLPGIWLLLLGGLLPSQANLADLTELSEFTQLANGVNRDGGSLMVAEAEVNPMTGGKCLALANSLSATEQQAAASAWTYFVDNFQSDTGFTNAVSDYPASTLWDLGTAIAALNAAHALGLVDQGEFDARINLFLTHLGNLPLYDDRLPNKVYNAATKAMVDYNNQATPRGIGWSTLDIGRLLIGLHQIRTCHPQYDDWIRGIVSSWELSASVYNGQMYGGLPQPDGSTMRVQEGRLGYEEYAARGYAVWGFDLSRALASEPYETVDIYGIPVPVDRRDHGNSNGNNYVVSETYILEGIEFGFSPELADFAQRVFAAQERRAEATGLLTAVSEGNVDQPPYFLYNTVYANGEPWAVITGENEGYPHLRTLSTKAALGWHYLYPDSAYGQQLRDRVWDITNTGRGFLTGLYESGLNQPTFALNQVLACNTNGIILEILYYKARGGQPLLGEAVD
jgi:hypothetical protein